MFLIVVIFVILWHFSHVSITLVSYVSFITLVSNLVKASKTNKIEEDDSKSNLEEMTGNLQKNVKWYCWIQKSPIDNWIHARVQVPIIVILAILIPKSRREGTCYIMLRYFTKVLRIWNYMWPHPFMANERWHFLICQLTLVLRPLTWFCVKVNLERRVLRQSPILVHWLVRVTSSDN